MSETSLNPKQRGLGRGLNALFDDEETGFSSSEKPESTETQQGLKIVGVEQVSPNPDQPRQNFDEKALEELAQSIQLHGILQPLVVRQKPHSDNQYEIIAGERRWRAAQLAQVHEIPVIIKDLEEAQTFQVALIENLQREDLNSVEEALGYKRLIDEFGHSPESVGEVLGKSRSYVANAIRLLHLPNSVQVMVRRGDISAGHARAIVNTDNPTLLAQEIIARGLSVRQTEKLVAEQSGRQKQPKSRSQSSGPQKDTDTLALEREISNALGMHVSIDMKSSSAGSLSVNFQNLDQLDEILQRLSSR